MLAIFTQSYENLVKLVFYIYDFDNNGKISKDDIKLIFSYIPLTTKTLASLLKFKYEQNDDKDRKDSLLEIDTYLEKIFEKKEFLTEIQFLNSIGEISSEIFLYVI